MGEPVYPPAFSLVAVEGIPSSPLPPHNVWSLLQTLLWGTASSRSLLLAQPPLQSQVHTGELCLPPESSTWTGHKVMPPVSPLLPLPG